jgi:hypothetical protein
MKREIEIICSTYTTIFERIELILNQNDQNTIKEVKKDHTHEYIIFSNTTTYNGL